jgi:hypothetical protein
VAETVTIQGESYLKRNPLGVLGLTIITLGIYGLYWYYKVNEEILRYTGDQTISPSRSLLAVIPGFLLIVPPFIAYYNTAGNVMIGRRELGSSAWQTFNSGLTATAAEMADDHNIIAIAVDGAGRMHTSWNMHNQSLR